MAAELVPRCSLHPPLGQLTTAHDVRTAGLISRPIWPSSCPSTGLSSCRQERRSRAPAAFSGGTCGRDGGAAV